MSTSQLDASITCSSAAEMHFLELPIEIRQRIYSHLFHDQRITVLPAVPDLYNLTWRMQHLHLNLQILRTCRQVWLEAKEFLYTESIFDCSQPDGPQILHREVGASNFSLVRQMVLDWDQLQGLVRTWLVTSKRYCMEGSGASRHLRGEPGCLGGLPTCGSNQKPTNANSAKRRMKCCRSIHI